MGPIDYNSVVTQVRILVTALKGVFSCLLYTSDAADDSLRVDLGGRRIIKTSHLIISISGFSFSIK